MLPELENLRARLGDAKGALDKEHLKSADLENKCQQLEEELKFKMSLLEKELIIPQVASSAEAFDYLHKKQQNNVVNVVQRFIKLWPYLKGGLNAERSHLLGKSRVVHVQKQIDTKRGKRATPPLPPPVMVPTHSLTR